MKVLYDHQIFEHQVYGGISKYFYQLINSIENRDHEEIEYSLPISYSSNEYIKSIPTVSKNLSGGSEYYKDFLLGFEFPGKWRIFKKWRDIFPDFNKTNQRITISALIKGEYDIFHPTDIDDYFLPHLGRKPFVITVHDMIDEYFPEYGFHIHSNYHTSTKEKLIRKAAGIIAVSDSTKRDILERFDMDENKIDGGSLTNTHW